jgi:hypothetical protein
MQLMAVHHNIFVATPLLIFVVVVVPIFSPHAAHRQKIRCISEFAIHQFSLHHRRCCHLNTSNTNALQHREH